MSRLMTWLKDWWARSRIAIATFFVAVAIAVVTAILALVVEDLLPVDSPRRWAAGRIGALLAALAVLGLTIWYRTRVYRQSGTVFYARVLTEGMQDFHDDAVVSAVRRRMALRTVTGWMDTSQQTPAGIIDAVEAATTTAGTLTLLLNTDRDDTGSTVAPNMLWPVALSVGYLLPGGSSHTMLELGAADPAATGAAAEVEWELPKTLTPSALAVLVDRTLTRIDGTVTTPIPGADRVGLMLAFGKAARLMQPEIFFAAFGVCEYVVLQPSDVSPDRRELQHGCFDARKLTALAQVLPAVISDVKQRAGDRELVIAAAMPKTLAVALGMGIARHGIRFFAGTHFLNWQASARTFVPMRTHPSQPSTFPR